MTVPMTQLFMHLGHGDTKGECPAAKVNPIKVNPRPNLNMPSNGNKTEIKTDTLNKQPINSPRRPR